MTRKSRLLTDDEKRRIVERYQDGEAASTIAASFGRANSAIFRVLHAAGVNISSKHPRQKGGLKNGAGRKPPTKMARAGHAPKTDGRWMHQLGALVARIRKTDPGVLDIEINVQNNCYVIHRTMSERGEIA